MADRLLHSDPVDRLLALPQHLLESPLLAIAMTLLAFVLGNMLLERLKRPTWCPPIMAMVIFLVPMIAILPISYAQYADGAFWISFLLGPATVALGVPLYQQFPHIRALLVPILATLLIGASLAVAYTVGIAYVLGVKWQVLLSLASKSVTAPIAMGITEGLGGLVSLTVGVVMITGVFCSLIGADVARLMKIQDDRVIGFAMGLNGHGIGTARAFEISPVAGAFSSLAMGLTGGLTAILLPVVVSLL